MEYCIETTSTWLCTREALYDVGLFENVKAHQDNILLLKLLQILNLILLKSS